MQDFDLDSDEDDTVKTRTVRKTHTYHNCQSDQSIEHDTGAMNTVTSVGNNKSLSIRSGELTVKARSQVRLPNMLR